MINPNVELLEDYIFISVNKIYKKLPPTEEEFLEEATSVRNLVAPKWPVSDVEFAEIISRLKES